MSLVVREPKQLHEMRSLEWPVKQDREAGSGIGMMWSMALGIWGIGTREYVYCWSIYIH
jgi:hypothetical protein